MIRVAIIEDHQVLIDALDLMMQLEGAFMFVGGANTLASGRELLASKRPDVLLLDLGLPDGYGLDLLPVLPELSPTTRVIILTGHSDETTLMACIEAGARGFLQKGCSLNGLLSSISKVYNGETIIPQELLLSLLKQSHREKTIHNHENDIWENLTPREYEILVQLAAGKTGEEIASQFNIAPLTVRTHVRNLMSKLGVHSRLEAVAFGFKHGILSRPQETPAYMY